jgi:hypothetical protein
VNEFAQASQELKAGLRSIDAKVVRLEKLAGQYQRRTGSG